MQHLYGQGGQGVDGEELEANRQADVGVGDQHRRKTVAGKRIVKGREFRRYKMDAFGNRKANIMESFETQSKVQRNQ